MIISSCFYIFLCRLLLQPSFSFPERQKTAHFSGSTNYFNYNSILMSASCAHVHIASTPFSRLDHFFFNHPRYFSHCRNIFFCVRFTSNSHNSFLLTQKFSFYYGNSYVRSFSVSVCYCCWWRSRGF